MKRKDFLTVHAKLYVNYFPTDWTRFEQFVESKRIQRSWTWRLKLSLMKQNWSPVRRSHQWSFSLIEHLLRISKSSSASSCQRIKRWNFVRLVAELYDAHRLVLMNWHKKLLTRWVWLFIFIRVSKIFSLNEICLKVLFVVSFSSPIIMLLSILDVLDDISLVHVWRCFRIVF